MRTFHTFVKRHRRQILVISVLLLILYPAYLILFHFPSVKELSTHQQEITSIIARNWTYIENSIAPINKEIFSNRFVIDQQPVSTWILEPTYYCNKKFIGYGHLFALLSNVTIHPNKNYNHKGGEEILEVQNQPENAEYLTLEKGYFTLNCEELRNKIEYNFSNKDPKSQWLNYIEYTKSNINSNIDVLDRFVVAVQRYEYVNVYHTMTDWYNTFLMSVIFKQDPDNVSVLWMDAHPKGSLDSVWSTLFKSTMQAGRMTKPIYFRNLAWSINGYDSFILQHERTSVPYLDEFRTFFLHQFNISTKGRRDCQSLNILFLFRHDYIAHPRNMQGVVRRKMANEKELIFMATKTFSGHKISGVQLDSFTFKKQLEIIANTDILIGMHGAGLTMAIFLPNHAALIELYPSYFSTNNVHFMSIAKWRKLTYFRWQNGNQLNERANYNTYIDPETVNDLINKAKSKLCNTK